MLLCRFNISPLSDSWTDTLKKYLLAQPNWSALTYSSSLRKLAHRCCGKSASGNGEHRILQKLGELCLRIQVLVTLINPMILLACKPFCDITGHQELDKYQQLLHIVPPHLVRLYVEQQDPYTQCQTALNSTLITLLQIDKNAKFEILWSGTSSEGSGIHDPS